MLHLLAYFFGGAFAANGLPHFVNGMSGRGFPTPFADPPGQGESSSRTNVLWGACNFVLAYLLIFQVGTFDMRNSLHIGLAGLGALILALGLSWRFGGLYGGKAAGRKRAD
jgi:hypothetical protein